MTNHNGHNGSTPAGQMMKSMGELTHDVVTLAELQYDLLKTDVRDSLQRLITPIIAIGAALLLLAACFPIALACLAVVLIELVGLQAWLSVLIATITGLVFAGAMAWYAKIKVQDSFVAFNRSRSEFNRNIKWLKRVLKPSTRRAAKTDFSVH